MCSGVCCLGLGPPQLQVGLRNQALCPFKLESACNVSVAVRGARRDGRHGGEEGPRREEVRERGRAWICRRDEGRQEREPLALGWERWRTET